MSYQQKFLERHSKKLKNYSKGFAENVKNKTDLNISQLLKISQFLPCCSYFAGNWITTTNIGKYHEILAYLCVAFFKSLSNNLQHLGILQKLILKCTNSFSQDYFVLVTILISFRVSEIFLRSTWIWTKGLP